LLRSSAENNARMDTTSPQPPAAAGWRRFTPRAGGRAQLSVVYIAVATALLIADRVLWAAALHPAGAEGHDRRGLRAGQPTPTGLIPSLDETA
jgi:hypothetical protein